MAVGEPLWLPSGCSLRFLWADTTTPHGRLMLTVLGGPAEFELYLILARTSEGRHRAQARGVKFGRKPKLTAHQQAEALARRAAGETLVDIASSYAVSTPLLRGSNRRTERSGGGSHPATPF
jgi:DNA invertase Pin-like site-specific DNA recombinase